MWKCALLWTAITSFIISSASHTFQDYDSPISDSRRHLESQWAHDPFTQRSPMPLLDLNSFLDEASSEPAEEVLLESMPQKKNREGHSLSIVNPLDVLRQRLMLEMARRRMKENQEQIRENALILKNLGKRSKTNKGGSKTNQDYHTRLQISSSEDLEV